jgi:hypothetical protein
MEDIVRRRKRAQNPCLVGAQLGGLRAGHGGALLGKDLRQPLLGCLPAPVDGALQERLTAEHTTRRSAHTDLLYAEPVAKHG